MWSVVTLVLLACAAVGAEPIGIVAPFENNTQSRHVRVVDPLVNPSNNPVMRNVVNYAIIWNPGNAQDFGNLAAYKAGIQQVQKLCLSSQQQCH
jgi:hypothetical protein